MPKKSDELNAALAETIRALPSAVLSETARELREAGLHAEADRVEEILAERDTPRRGPRGQGRRRGRRPREGRAASPG